MDVACLRHLPFQTKFNRPDSALPDPAMDLRGYYGPEAIIAALVQASQPIADFHTRGAHRLTYTYGALSAYEDFAETFALFVHTRILGKPYAVVVRDGGRVIGIYYSCLQTGSRPAKAAFVERLLGAAR